VFDSTGAEDGGQIIRLDRARAGLALGDPNRRIAHDGTEFAVQIAESGFTRVVADHPRQRLVTDIALFRGQTRLLQLFADQVAASDLQLFLMRIAGNLDDFHTVT